MTGLNLPPIMTPDGRRAWAFAAIVGGCVVFTLFAAVGVWLVSDHAEYAFYLALAAHAQVFVGMTCIGALLVKRTIRAGRDGNIGICYVGGCNKQMAPMDTRTPAQKVALRTLIRTYQARYPGIIIRGHRDWPKVAKACPSFDVAKWLADGMPA